MEEDISLDIKEWMSEVKKPRNLTVQDPINDPGVQTPKFINAELARIVRNACPSGWKKAQIHGNLRHLSLAAQTRYYTGLGNIEPNENASHRNKIQETNRHTNVKANTPLTKLSPINH
jgi:hypothetical protein